MGKRILLYCSGVGKGLLLQEDDENILAKRSKVKFEKFTATTLETPKPVL